MSGTTSVFDWGQRLPLPPIDTNSRPTTSSSQHDPDIAPWETPSPDDLPSTSPRRGFAFSPSKSSLSSSLSIAGKPLFRQPSSSNLFNRSRANTIMEPGPNPIVTQQSSQFSFDSIELLPESSRKSKEKNIVSGRDRDVNPDAEKGKVKDKEPGKTKSIFGSILRRKASRPAIAFPRDDDTPIPELPFIPTKIASSSSSSKLTPLMTSTSTLVPPPHPSPTYSRKSRKVSKTKQSAYRPPTPSEPELPKGVLNLDDMDMEGIVDMNAVAAQAAAAASPTRYGRSSTTIGSSSSLGSEPYFGPGRMSPPNGGILGTFPSTSPFTNLEPFKTVSRQGRPMEFPPQAMWNPDFSSNSLRRAPSPAREWTAPTSWAQLDHSANVYDSSDEEDAPPRGPQSFATHTEGVDGSHRRSRSKAQNGDAYPRPPASAGSVLSTGQPKSQLRVYRPDGTYHVIQCPLHTTVQDLQSALTSKLPIRPDTSRLYIRERGRERPLGYTEKPAAIVRRRLEQAGYDEADHLEQVGGEDLTFMLQLIFRNATLGGAEGTQETLVLVDFEHVDLAERDLETIPIALHRNAHSIITLNLSRNPLPDLPVDFAEACVKLRHIRLSHVAMKRVPKGIREIPSLQWLDISCNRIIDLNDAALDRIGHLRDIRVQNNRLSHLPSYFAQMPSLKFLNISNNKFDEIPPILGEIHGLLDLDVSFNNVSEFSLTLTRLVKLERLIIIGNRIKSFPAECRNMVSLKELDCRRNSIADLSPLFEIPSLETVAAEHNVIHSLDLRIPPKLRTLITSNNPITRFKLLSPQPVELMSLTELDLSRLKLSAIEDTNLAGLVSLTSLKLDYNQLHSIPDIICSFTALIILSCTNNRLGSLPSEIGKLQKLQQLVLHNNNLKAIPESIWELGQLIELNASSNVLDHLPFPSTSKDGRPVTADASLQSTPLTASRISPLGGRLRRLLLADNRLTREVFGPLSHLSGLHVLNLSFNHISELPPLKLPTFAQLRELYLGGNNITSLPGEDLHKLTKLKVLYLNGNKLQTLPAELSKVSSLESLDVGCNVLKYNINNFQFDWNWNFNYELRYLNLSGNKKLEIKSVGTSPLDTTLGRRLSGFAELQKLKVLGLMDVTLVVTSPPDESDERRVRTSFAEINGMQYGIADTLGCSDTINLFDFAHPRFRSNDDECLFGIFGRAEPLVNSNRVAKFLQENFASTFASSLEKLDTRKNERVEDALRRSFLNLNKSLHEFLVPRLAQGRKLSATAGGTRDRDIKTGASGVVVYITANSSKKTMYVANVGNMLAVVSRASGEPLPVSRKHDPFERDETVRIRAAEGWVSPKGMVNDEVDLSRSFGLYHLLPAVNARPDIHTHELLPDDELVIIGNRGLWDHVSYQTAVDIARSSRHDPMMAAQMLRDFAMGYGADGNTMIMVIDVSQLHQRGLPRTRLPTLDSAADAAELFARPSGPRREGDRTLARLDREVPPPVGQVALVFTDIRNSTVLWETNAGVPVAMALHNELLRRQLRIFGGYTVKTEGDSFMASFPSVASALLWCVSVQMLLLREDWPLEILECDEGREIHGLDGKLLARGLSVRMGIHVGRPVCELDPITDRMDYFGPVVNRASRVSGMAKGGEIMISGDVMNEVVALGILEKSDDEDVNLLDPHADRLRRIGLDVTDQGEKILKGFEAPERLTLVFPKELLGRKNLNVLLSPPTLSSRVHYSVEQMKQLALLCIRLEALASSRVFRDISERPASSTTREKRRSQQVAGAAGSDDDSADEHQPAALMYADARLMMPPITNVATDEDLIVILDSLSTRIENSLATLSMRHMTRLWSSAGDIEKMSLIEELLSMHRG